MTLGKRSGSSAELAEKRPVDSLIHVASNEDLHKWVESADRSEILEQRWDLISAATGLKKSPQEMALYDDVVNAVSKTLHSYSARILDAGCGPGSVGVVLHNAGYKNLSALDLSQGMLNEARKAKVYTEYHKMFIGEHMDFPVDSFDCVVSVQTLNYDHTPATALNEFIRIVRPGGFVIFTIKNHPKERQLFEKQADKLSSNRWWRKEDIRVLSYKRARETVEHVLYVYEVLVGMQDIGDINLSPPSKNPGSSVATMNTPMEPRMLFAQEYMAKHDKNRVMNNHVFGLQRDSPIDLDTVKRSAVAVSDRHLPLRSLYKDSTISVPVEYDVHVEAIDLSSQDEAQASEALRSLSQSETYERVFNLAEKPGLRIHVVRLPSSRSFILVTLHPMVADYETAKRFSLEFTEAYHNFEAHGDLSSANLPELTTSVSHLAQAQSASGRKVLESALRYWDRKLGSTLPVMELPYARIKQPDHVYNGKKAHYELSPVLTESIKVLSAQGHTTILSVFAAAYSTLLYSYTGMNDIVLGTLVKSFPMANARPIIAPTHITALLRCRFEGNESFEKFLEIVHDVISSATQHTEIPLIPLLEELGIRNTHGLLHTLLIVDQETGPYDLSGGFQHENIGTCTSHFDTKIFIREEQGKFQLSMEYDENLFEAFFAEQMLSHFGSILKVVAGHTNERLNRINYLSSAEKRKLIHDWNDTSVPFSHHLCVHQLFEQQVELTPSNIAVGYEDTTMSYKELNEAANRLANYLVRLKVGPGSVVGLYLERSHRVLIAMLGILKAGGAYVPLDPLYPRDRIEYMMDDAKIAVLLTEQHLVDALPKTGARFLCMDTDWSDVEQMACTQPAVTVSPTHRSYIIYTSGSTGRPKGVQICHRSVVNFLQSYGKYTRMQPSDVLVAVTTICFDVSVLEIFLPITYGARTHFCGQGVSSDGEKLKKLLISTGCTIFQATPITYKILIGCGWRPDPDLRVLSCGEAITKNLAEQILDLGITFLLNAYGPTETCIFSMVKFLTKESLAKEGVTIGTPIDNTQILILDEQMRLCPIGVPGELYIGGVGLSLGYLNRLDLTEEKFVPNVYAMSPGHRLYRTNDSSRLLPNGTVEFLGRLDNQVKIRGFRIELGEIENVIMEYSDVKEAVCVAVTDNTGDSSLAAYIIERNKSEEEESTADRSQLDSEEIQQWQLIYNAAYAEKTALKEDPTLNFSGYDDSYTRLPHKDDVVREWVESTCERILDDKPSSVLEMGCGNGMLLWRIAPKVKRFIGADMSDEAVTYVRQILATPKFQMPHVSVCQKTAEDFSGFQSERFDGIVVNGVVMYFPSVDYLLQVITNGIETLQDGGCLFMGDIRSFHHLKHFHAAVQTFQAEDSLPAADLITRFQSAAKWEKEFLVDPDFFYALEQHLPDVTQVRVQLKRGVHHSEFTRYRYDVYIYKGKRVVPVTKPANVLDFNDVKQRSSAAEIQKMLQNDNMGDCISIVNVPNARLIKETKLLNMLEDLPQDLATAGDIKKAIEEFKPECFDPEDFYKLAYDTDYNVEITFSNAFTQCMDILIWRKTGPVKTTETVASPTHPIKALRPWHEYANKDVKGDSGVQIVSSSMVPDLKTFLRNKLPEYMVPATYVFLTEFPLTNNGKIKRDALPDPDPSLDVDDASYVAPITDTEKAICRFWCTLFRLSIVSSSANFFELGGHSLLATKLISMIRERFSVELSLRAIFDHPILTDLARRVDILVSQKDMFADEPSATAFSTSVDILDSFPYKVDEIPITYIPMRDGVRLAAHMWLPRGINKPVPAVLEYLPYANRDQTAVLDSMTHPYFAGNGFACLRVDIRGFGESEGEFTDEYVKQEQDDALDVLAWIEKQSWSNGSVGMMGVSWGGFNSLQVAARRPKQLKCIITLMATDDRYADDMHYQGGALLNENLSWSTVMMRHITRAPDPALFGPKWKDEWVNRLENCSLLAEQWLQHETRDSNWKHGSVCEDYSAIQCPVYAFGGWFAGGYTNAVERLMSNLKVPRKGVIGPWCHQYPHISPTGPQAGFLQEALMWWKHWMCQENTTVMDGPMLRVWMRESTLPEAHPSVVPGTWVAEKSCPLPRPGTEYYLNARGLDTVAPDSEPYDISICSPVSTGVSGGEWVTFGVSPDLPVDQRDDDGRSSCFDGLPLRKPLQILGVPVLQARLKADRPKATLVVRLNDVFPDGTSVRISYGVLNLCHRKGHENPSLLTPGEEFNVKIPLNFCGYTVAAGHRLRVAVSTTYWPIVWPTSQPATVTLLSGATLLQLPERAPKGDDALVKPLPPPQIAQPLGTSVLRSGRRERNMMFNYATNERQITVVEDDGAMRITPYQLKTESTSTKRYLAKDDDPSSARLTIQWEARSSRDDEFDVSVEGQSSMEVKPGGVFYLESRIAAYENKSCVYRSKWKNTVQPKFL